MEQSHNLKLPYIMAAQAQKHVTHNEAVRMLDTLVHPMVQTMSLSAPPLEPAEGENYIVATDATGAWVGQDGFIAAFQDGAWGMFEPREGWQVWVRDEKRFRMFDGEEWILRPVEADMLGVNATADAENRLAVASGASLFNHDGAGHRLKINKSAAAETASLLFQDGFSGRAEIGLAGDDDLRFKVSADGAGWAEALVARRSDGKVSFPAGLVSPLAVANGGTGASTALSALAALGLRREVGNIADDTVATVNFGTAIFGSVIFVVGNTTSVPLGTVFARMASSPQLVPLGIAGGTLGAFTTSLSGTTGPDGQVNMAALDGGVFQIENRRGFTINYSLYLFR